MRRLLILALLCLMPAAALAAPPDEPRSFGADETRIHRAGPGGALTGPSSAAPASVAAQYLARQGVDAATVGSLRVVSESRAPTGLTHLRMEQEVEGLRVEGAYVKAATNARGELVHLIEGLAPVKGRVAAARASEREALAAALAALHPGVAAPAQASRQGNSTTFARSSFFHAAPTVERVAIAMRSGALKEGFLVQTWSAKGNLLHETLVSGEGRVLSTELRTANDSYNVFRVDPVTTPQQVVAGPGTGNTESPAGWLFPGAHSTWNIAGNNVHAYLDAINDSVPDPGGTPVLDGNFVTVADLTVTPATEGNRNVAVQNLFYLNNVIHDTLYRAGFTEATGNFQELNAGKDGKGSDSVNAEAQDGGGTDNANFATPRDGVNPRMQMYLWTGKGNMQLVVHTPASIAGTYRAQSAAFGGSLDPTGITADLVLVNDGVGPSTSDACQALPAGSLAGRIALMDRGNCGFVVKVKNVQNAGALVAVVANNAGDSIITMGGEDPTITIPAIFISRTDGTTLKGGLATGPGSATARRTDPPPLQRDGDLDSDIVWHEYGHGLTWRMIGRMNGPLAGAIGEGMSDVLAIVVNDQDTVGEYSFDDPLGIRSAPYTNYPRTYGDVAGTGVHFDGEVYAAIGWRLWKSYQAAGFSRDLLLRDLLGGMTFTPEQPFYEDMRDGILAWMSATGVNRSCLVWDAFAAYGVGVGASAKVKGTNVVVSESFVLPAQCQP
ncbi:MAG TPA: M36 family metallopeptidase [Aggregicoccus sp.]|nr:M36 family metallopeptidase [Aggregicoccus sp.]